MIIIIYPIIFILGLISVLSSIIFFFFRNKEYWFNLENDFTYIDSLFYCIMIITTIGDSNITPKNKYLKICISCFSIVLILFILSIKY